MLMSKCQSLLLPQPLLLMLLLLLHGAVLSLLADVLRLRSPEQSLCSLDRIDWDCVLLLGSRLAPDGDRPGPQKGTALALGLFRRSTSSG